MEKKRGKGFLTGMKAQKIKLNKYNFQEKFTKDAQATRRLNKRFRASKNTSKNWIALKKLRIKSR